jgi:superfamily II DNA or RNA helicase
MQTAMFHGQSAPQMTVLRPYQEEAVSAVMASLGENRSSLIVMATGTGKTQVFVRVALGWPHGRVLIVAHRAELIEQAVKRLEGACGVGVEQSWVRSTRHDHVVVASNMSIFRDSRLERLRAEGGFGLVVIDEAHHATAMSYRKIVEAFPGAKVLGVTATPDRADEQALGQIFEDVAYEYSISSAIADGWLVPICGESIRVSAVDLDAVSLSQGDLSAAQLDVQLVKAGAAIADHLVKREPERKGIVYMPGVASSVFVAERLNILRPNSAVCVDGKMDTDDRRRAMSAFRDGEVQWLVNCMVATEGFDVPMASVIAIGRQTLSRALYAQMIGRGTRPAPGVTDGLGSAEDRKASISRSTKPSCTVYDFVGNNTRHSLVSPVDVLGGEYSEAERDLARKNTSEPDVTKRLESARKKIAELAAMKAEIKASVANIARVDARVASTSSAFDLFQVVGFDVKREEWYNARYGYRPPSKAQIDALVRRGFRAADLAKISKHGASKILGSATPKQIAQLRKFGITQKHITIDSASAAMSLLASRGWSGVSKKELEAIIRSR